MKILKLYSMLWDSQLALTTFTHCNRVAFVCFTEVVLDVEQRREEAEVKHLGDEGTIKLGKIQTTEKNAIIILKLEKCGFTTK